jgi:hypothetical protein
MITVFFNNQTQLSYDYRVIAHEYFGEHIFSIHAVYYDENYNPTSFAEEPVCVEEEDMIEIHALLDGMRDATLKPILSAKNFPDEFNIEE